MKSTAPRLENVLGGNWRGREVEEPLRVEEHGPQVLCPFHFYRHLGSYKIFFPYVRIHHS